MRPDLSDREFAEEIVKILDFAIEGELSDEEKSKLFKIAIEERAGIEQWALEGFLKALKEKKSYSDLLRQLPIKRRKE